MTCVDLEDPVFIRSPPKLLGDKTDQETDSVYSSNESLVSSKPGRETNNRKTNGLKQLNKKNRNPPFIQDKDI